MNSLIHWFYQRLKISVNESISILIGCFLGSYVQNQVQFPALWSQIWFSSIYLYPEQTYQVKENGVTEVTSFPVGGKVFLQQTSEC